MEQIEFCENYIFRLDPYDKAKLGDYKLKIMEPSQMVCLVFNFRQAVSKAKGRPVAPKNIKDIDTGHLGDTLLAQDLEKGLFLFGTFRLLKEFCNSKFKSADATYQICPKLFYQVPFRKVQGLCSKRLLSPTIFTQ